MLRRLISKFTVTLFQEVTADTRCYICWLHWIWTMEIND